MPCKVFFLITYLSPNSEAYDLLGAGATIPSQHGSIRCILPQSISSSSDGDEQDVKLYRALVGTTNNCIVSLVMSLTTGNTDIQDLQIETLVQGHLGAANAVTPVNNNQFLSCGEVSLYFFIYYLTIYIIHVTHPLVVNQVTSHPLNQYWQMIPCWTEGVLGLERNGVPP